MPPQKRDDGKMCQSRLKELRKLYSQHTPQTAYVAIDFEAQTGGRHAGVYQMGVAVLPPSAILQQDDNAGGDGDDNDDDDDDDDDEMAESDDAVVGYACPDLTQDPQTIMAQNQIESYSYHILSDSHPRTENWMRRRERLCLFGDEIPVDIADMDAQLLALLVSFRDRFQARLDDDGGGCPRLAMVLVGYCMGMEDRLLQRHCPAVVDSDLFACQWDLQPVVDQVSGANALGLINAIWALGAVPGDPCPLAPGPHTRSKQHQAGNDVVRTLVVLVRLLHHAQAQAQTEKTRPGTLLPSPFHHEALLRAAEEKRKRKQQRQHTGRQETSRPQPYSAYPFTVGVRFVSGDYIVSADRPTAALAACFAAYRPVLVTMHRHRIGGWVCLATAAERDRFIAEVDGKACGEQVWQAYALSPERKRQPYTPQGQLTRHGRRTQRAAQVAAQGAAQVQSRRAQWRAELEEVDEDVLAGVGLLDLEDS